MYTLVTGEDSSSSLTQTGSEGSAHYYNLDKTTAGYVDSTKVGDAWSGEYTLEEATGNTSTAIETLNHGSNHATFTEVLSEDNARAESGNEWTGEYSLFEVGTRGADFVDWGAKAGDSFFVTEGSSASYDRGKVGNRQTGAYSLGESAETDYSWTQTHTGSLSSFTLTGAGTDAASVTEEGDEQTGDYSRTEDGTDLYTLAEWGSNWLGSFSESLSGTDHYTGTEEGNHDEATFDRTTSGGGDWDRSATGSGAQLGSGSGTNTYTLTETGDSLAGHFSKTSTGQHRYNLIDHFNDVSNTGGGDTPGNITFHSHGLPFRDPGAPLGTPNAPSGKGKSIPNSFSTEGFAWRQAADKLYFQMARYYTSLDIFYKMKAFKTGDGEVLYDINKEYADLVDAYRAYVEHLYGIEGLIEERGGVGDYRWSVRKDGHREFLKALMEKGWSQLPAAKPGPKLGDEFTQLQGQIAGMQEKYRLKGVTRFVGGGLGGVQSTFEAIYNIDEVPVAVKKLLTDPRARKALITELEKKLDAIAAGDAEALGELTVELPGLITGVGAGATVAKTGAKYVLKVSGQSLKALGKEGVRKLTGKELIDFLKRAGNEAREAKPARTADPNRSYMRMPDKHGDGLPEPSPSHPDIGSPSKPNNAPGAGAAPKTTVKGAADVAHEGPQATRFGDLQGGGEFEFYGNSSQGVEGVFRPTGQPGVEIPVSLKSFNDVEKLGSLLKAITRNANQAQKVGVKNGILYGEPIKFTAEQLADFAKNGPLYKNIVREGVYNKVILKASDGIVEITAEGVKIIK